MFKKLVSKIVGDPNQKIIQDLQPIVDEVAALEPKYQAMADEELKGETAVFKQRLEDGETLDDILPEAYALVREAYRHAPFRRANHGRHPAPSR